MLWFSDSCGLMYCSPLGSSVHGIFPVRILEWVAISFSRESSRLRIQPASPALASRFFTTEPPEKEVVSYLRPKTETIDIPWEIERGKGMGGRL